MKKSFLLIFILIISFFKSKAQEVAVKNNSDWEITISKENASKIFQQFFPDFDGRNFGNGWYTLFI
jgi:hypothetical protein